MAKRFDLRASTSEREAYEQPLVVRPLEPQPGLELEMEPVPATLGAQRRGGGRLEGKVVLITGGDSGIGRATAILCAKEGADLAIVYLDEHEDAERTKREVEAQGRIALTIAGDIGDQEFCRRAVSQTIERFEKLDVLINNAAEQHPQAALEDITAEQLQSTFRTNIFGMFYMTQAALKHLREGGAIVNTTSVTAYSGKENLIDYSATKGAIVSFTRSLSQALVERGIRVNAVAPGPIWTPLIPATFSAEEIAEFGKSVPMKRPGRPEEVAPSFVFLASSDASYMTGQVLHPNGGRIVES